MSSYETKLIFTNSLISLNDKDWNKMIEQLDAFFAGWEKSTNKKKKRDNDKRKRNISEETQEDDEYIPTKYDKFEQYYLERELRNSMREAKTMNEMLHDLGLELPPEELN